MAMIRANVVGLSAETLPRSDRFVRSLAQQLGEIRSMLEAVFDEPESEEVRQRLTEVIRVFCAQAVKAGDRVLVEHFNACDAMLQQVAVFGQLDAQDAEMLSETFERIADHVRTELACEITPTTGSIKTLIPATGKVEESELIDIDPVHVLIVAPPRVVDGLVLDHDQRGEAGPPLAIEQVSDVISAREVVRALGPEVMVVDTALDGAQGFVESLVNDALTNAIPIVALGDWSSPEEAAPFIALGVARHLHKPVSPRSLRRTLNELSPGQANGFDPMAAGTLDEISARLADELHRGLCDAAPEEDRLRRIDVGDGSELLATMWTAVGRLQNT